MRLRAQPVTVPCVAFDVRATLGDASGLTPVERIALRAIGAGLDNVDDLAAALSLGQRLLLDLIYDFWLKGYVVVDTDSARVQLAGEAERAWQTSDWSQLDTAENNTENVSLLQELVSGAVLPNIGRPSPQGTESAMVPTVMGGLELDVIPREALLDALRDAVGRQSRQESRPLAVREAWVEPEQILRDGSTATEGGPRRRYLSLLVDVVCEPASGELSFEIIDAPDVAPGVRRSIEKGLTDLSRRFPTHLFFKHLREQLAGDLDDAHRAPEDSVQRLARAVRDLEDADPGVLEQRHGELTSLYERARADVVAGIESQATVQSVLGYDAHDAIIRSMLATARRQIIIGNPWLKLSALLESGSNGASWFDLFERALARGVQVVLFWGISTDATLDAPVRNALVQLRERHQNRFIWTTRPSVSHAKFVVRDAGEALITSYNFLDPSPNRDTLEIGLRVTGVAPRQTTTAILELLRWARDSFPDYQLGRRIRVLPEDLDATDSPTWDVRAPDPVNRDIRVDTDVQASALRHWAYAWRNTAEVLQTRRQGLRRGVALIVDRMHRVALAHALERSEQRLVILSDKLSIDVVTDSFVVDLRQRLERGASCALMFRRQGASDSTAGPETRLQHLAADFPENFSLTNASSHAKLLVSDDEAVVGSFNFLSYSSDYERAGRGERAELSLHAQDPEVVQTILAALAERWPSAFTRLVTRRPLSGALTVRATPPAALQPLFRELQRADDHGSVLMQWFAGRAAPWRDLDALHNAGVPEPLLCCAVGAALAGAHTLTGADGRRWQRWLAEQRWRAGDLVGSALLLPPDETASDLEPWLVQLGAAVAAALPPDPPAREPTKDGPRQAMILLAIADVLLHGRDVLAPLLERTEGLSRPLGRWAAGARDHFAATRGPLPLVLLARLAGHHSHQQAVAETRDRFRQALDSVEQIGFRFHLGQHTWERLRTPEYLLGAMRTNLDSDDPAALDHFLTVLDEAGKSVENVMDEVSYAVRDSHLDRIAEPKRSVCLKRLNLAHTAAWRWVELAGSGVLKPADRHRVAACWPLRRALGELTVASLHPLAEPVRSFLCARLQPLFDAEEP